MKCTDILSVLSVDEVEKRIGKVPRARQASPAAAVPKAWNGAIDQALTAMVPMTFPIGYHSLHSDASMNFQMNRWFGWVGEPDMLEEMRMAAPRIANYTDWKREFLGLAERASRQGHVLRAGFYFRSAEFFMRPNDPERNSARENFLGAMLSVYGLDKGERHSVPYADGRLKGFLPAYRFTPLRAKSTIVFFGGFDSYIEELLDANLRQTKAALRGMLRLLLMLRSANLVNGIFARVARRSPVVEWGSNKACT